MNDAQESNGGRSSAWTLGIAATLIVFTFAVLDAGALAWSASVISGRQLAGELLTLFIILAGGAVTVWWMKTAR